MGRAQARPPFTLFRYRPPGAASGQPRPTGRPRQTSSTDDLSAWHSARTHSPRTQAGPVILPADWEACAARRDGCDAAHPGGRFPLAGRAWPEAEAQAVQVPLPRTAQGAPGTYKGVPGAVLVSLHPGEGLTTAP